MAGELKMKPSDGTCLLYVLYHAPNREIKGSVKFNKILAKLYTEGLKKDVPLVLLQQGSAVPEVDLLSGDEALDFPGILAYGRVWEKEGMLEITPEKIERMNDRIDYKLTQKGKSYFEQNIHKQMEKESLITHEQAIEIIKSMDKLGGSRASRQEHDEFLFDKSDDEKKQMLEECLSTLDQKYQVLCTYPQESLEFEIAGMVGFVMGVLKKVLNDFYTTITEIRSSEEFLAHHYILKMARDFCKLLGESKKNTISIERKYSLIKHIAIESRIIHLPTSEDFEMEYFLDAGAIKLLPQTQ